MSLSNGEKIKIIMKRLNITTTTLAEIIGTSRQNLTNKFSRDKFDEEETRKIATAMGCEVETIFTLPDGTKI